VNVLTRDFAKRARKQQWRVEALEALELQREIEAASASATRRGVNDNAASSTSEDEVLGELAHLQSKAVAPVNRSLQHATTGHAVVRHSVDEGAEMGRPTAQVSQWRDVTQRPFMPSAHHFLHGSKYYKHMETPCGEMSAGRLMRSLARVCLFRVILTVQRGVKQASHVPTEYSDFESSSSDAEQVIVVDTGAQRKAASKGKSARTPTCEAAKRKLEERVSAKHAESLEYVATCCTGAHRYEWV
jgi:hypothetical protein